MSKFLFATATELLKTPLGLIWGNAREQRGVFRISPEPENALYAAAVTSAWAAHQLLLAFRFLPTMDETVRKVGVDWLPEMKVLDGQADLGFRLELMNAKVQVDVKDERYVFTLGSSGSGELTAGTLPNHVAKVVLADLLEKVFTTAPGIRMALRI